MVTTSSSSSLVGCDQDLFRALNGLQSLAVSTHWPVLMGLMPFQIRKIHTRNSQGKCCRNICVSRSFSTDHWRAMRSSRSSSIALGPPSVENGSTPTSTPEAVARTPTSIMTAEVGCALRCRGTVSIVARIAEILGSWSSCHSR